MLPPRPTAPIRGSGSGRGKRNIGRRIAFGLLAPSLLLVSGCDKFPADMDGSLAKIKQRKTFSVGVTTPIPSEAEQLIAGLEKATGSKARIMPGSLEPLVEDLDAGRLDLIIAPFRQDSPLAADVALSPPIGQGATGVQWRAAMKNGENRWIMLIETEARAVVPEGGR